MNSQQHFLMTDDGIITVGVYQIILSLLVTSSSSEMFTSYYFLSFMLICLSLGKSTIHAPNVDVSLPSEITKEASLIISRLEDRAKFDYCYKEPVMLLKNHCNEMNSEEKSRLSLKLANCQLMENGKSPFPCAESKPLRECTM